VKLHMFDADKTIMIGQLGYRMVKKNYDNMLSRFQPIPERYKRTDGQRELLFLLYQYRAMPNRSRVSYAQYVQGIYRLKYYTMTLKSRLRGGAALARGSRGPDPPAAVRSTREIDSNPRKKTKQTLRIACNVTFHRFGTNCDA